jgi:uncharacterized membrane protein YgcG
LTKLAAAMKGVWNPFLKRGEREKISAVIGEAERLTTGEIHVHILNWAPDGDLLHEARRVFHGLGMHQTKHRNAVLILVSHSDRRFAIWGDEGMHSKAGQPLWDSAKETLAKHFKERKYAAGIEACVREVGRELAKHFPKEDGPGRNDVPNEVTES